MARLVRFNLLADVRPRGEAAGVSYTLLLDKTGTITLGTQAGDRLPSLRASPSQTWPMRRNALRSPTTPEGRFLVRLAEG